MKIFSTMILLFLLGALAPAEWVLQSGYPQGGVAASGSATFSTTGLERKGIGSGSPVKLDGPFTWKWAWTGTQPRPSVVVLKVYSRANWSGALPSSADNGQGDGEVWFHPTPGLDPISGNSEGTHYVSAQPEDNSLSYSLDLSAESFGVAGIQATAEILPISMSFIGTYSAKHKIAVGQKFRAVVNGLAGENDTYTWSTPSHGQPFPITRHHTPLRC